MGKILDENHIIYALLSNQIFVYDIKIKTISDVKYHSQNFLISLTQDKSKIIVADESGILTIFDTKI